MKLKPASLIVLEGLDATGKSTFMGEWQSHAVQNYLERPLFTHQPSGAPALGGEIYRMTEGRTMQPLTRQLLHLAAHTEHYSDVIIPALTAGYSVVMDRCWWSTMAYGYFGGGLAEFFPEDWFLELATAPTQGRMPDLVLLFMEPYLEDHHNTPEVEQGYWELAERYADRIAMIPQCDSKTKMEMVHNILEERELTC